MNNLLFVLFIAGFKMAFNSNRIYNAYVRLLEYNPCFRTACKFRFSY